MKVPILDPSKGNQAYIKELEETVIRVLNSGKYILGEEVERFEEECATLLKVKYAIGVSSGTDALLLSLMANDIGPGDEVICPTFTFFATAGSIARTGATPVFTDIDPYTFNMDPTSFYNAITKKTKAVIPVHLFGQSADMKTILNIADDHDLLVIEDACQSIGATYYHPDMYHEVLPVGGIGDLGCFSFFPSKNLGGFGDAGLISTNNKELADKIKYMRVHGCTDTYYHQYLGGNFRIDAIQAALLRVKLKYLKEIVATRIKNADFYNKELKDLYILPQKSDGCVWNQYTIRIPKVRDYLRQYLTNQGIATGIYYPTPLHKQPCLSKYVPENFSLPIAEQACKECLSLPIASELNELQISYVALHLQKYTKGLQ